MLKYILIKQNILIAVVIILLCYIMTYKLDAQTTSATFTIGPPTIKLLLNPGESKEGKLSLLNNSGIDQNFEIKVYDLIVNDNQGIPQILASGTEKNNPYSASSWIKIVPDKLTLKAHERIILKYLINSGLNAIPGGHYAAIVYEPISPIIKNGNITQVRTEIATLVYITVNGQITELAKVKKFYAPTLLEYGPVDIITEIINLGNVHINPKGKIVIQDIIGNIVYQSNLYDGNIFPGNIALEYKNVIGSHFMFGRYKAILSVTYGLKNNLALSSYLYFWVFPWKIVITLIIIIVITFLFIFYIIKKKRKYMNDYSSIIKEKEPETIN